MFRESERIRQATDALYERCAAMTYGDTIAHEEVAEIIGYRPGDPQKRYWTIVNKARKRLLDGMAFWLGSIPGAGFRVLPPGEQVREPSRQAIKAKRGLMRAVRVADATPNSVLTDHEVQVRNAEVEMAERHADAIARDVRVRNVFAERRRKAAANGPRIHHEPTADAVA